MRIEQQAAFVIHTRAFRDTSLLVDCFTQNFGRLTLVAKGARSSKSQLRVLLQPFQLLSLTWQGRSNLKTLTDVESLMARHSLEGYFLYSGLYVNEILLHLLPLEDASLSLFKRYQHLLQALDNQSTLEPTLRQFEFDLLQEIGYGIDFYCDANSGQLITENKTYHYSIGQGFIEVQNPDIKRDIMGSSIIAMANGHYDNPETLKMAKYITRQSIESLLDGKSLRSRDFFKQMMSL